MVIDRRDSVGSMPRLWLAKAAFFHSVRKPFLPMVLILKPLVVGQWCCGGRMRQSKWLVEEWLAAVAEGKTPGGAPTAVIRVRPGVIVEVQVGESRSDDSPAIRFAGRQPEYVGRSQGGKTLYVRFPASPSLVYEFRDLPDGRTERFVYLCATNAQIARAQAEAARVRETVAVS